MLKTSFIRFITTLFVLQAYANKMDPAYQTDDERNQPVESVPSEQAPWISGPQNQKYQFHIGKQSWLSAREKCLAQNADLVSIESFEEMQWLLSHYKPQFNHLRERQVQIGLLLDTIEGETGSNSDSTLTSREWRWVNGKPLNLEITKWTMGEPFDHAKGKERCALLNINERRLDDVDCDLGASSGFNYRFVCQRSHEKHIEHESLNNPLWKKLEDILTFFGISDKEDEKKNGSFPGAKEEGYWERAFKGEGNSETQNKETITEKSNTNIEKNELEKPKVVEENSKINKDDQGSVLEDKNIQEKKVTIPKEETNNKLSPSFEQKTIKDVEKVAEEKKVQVGGVVQHATSKIIGGEDEQPPNELENTRPTGGAVVLRRVESHVSASSSVDNKRKNNNQELLNETKEEVKVNQVEEEQGKILKNSGVEGVNLRENEASDSKLEKSGLSVREKSQIINLNSRENVQSSINPKKPLIIANVPSNFKDDRNTISIKNSSETVIDNKNIKNLSKSVQITEKKLGEDETSNIAQYTLENKYIVNGPKLDKNDKLKNEKISEEKISEKENDEGKIKNEKKDIKKIEDEKLKVGEDKKNKNGDNKEDKEIKINDEKNKEDKEVKKNEENEEKDIKEGKPKVEEKGRKDKVGEKEEMKNLLPNSNIRDDSKKLDLDNKPVVKEEKLEKVGKKDEDKLANKKKEKHETNLIKNKIKDEKNDEKNDKEIITIKEYIDKRKDEQKHDEKDKNKKDEEDKVVKKVEQDEDKSEKNIKEVKHDSTRESTTNKAKDVSKTKENLEVKDEARHDKYNEANRENKKEAKLEENKEVKEEVKHEAKDKTKTEATEGNRKEAGSEAKSETETKQEANKDLGSHKETNIEANKPTKQPDPLSVVAETLERSLSSKEETVEMKKEEDENLIKEKQKPDGVRDRIQHLEKIITAVQQMMGIGDKGGEGGQIEKTNKVLEEDEEEGKFEIKKEENKKKEDKKVKEKEEKIRVEEKEESKEGSGSSEKQTEAPPIAEVEEFSSPEFEPKSHSPSSHSPSVSSSNESDESEESPKHSKTKNIKDNKSQKETAVNINNGAVNKSHSIISDSIDEQKRSMAAMEFDFEEAALQSKAHPGINSGDLVKNIILIGKDEDLNECKEVKEGKECKDKKAKSKQNRRFSPKNDEKWEIINKMSEDTSAKKGKRIEKYGRKSSVNSKKGTKGEEIEEKGGADDLNIVNRKHDEGLVNSIHSETLEATPNGHILDQLIIFHPNDGKRSRESQIISQMLLPEGGFHGKVTGDGKIEQKPIDDDWVLPDIETQTSSGDISSNSTSSSTPLSIFPAPDFSMIKPGDQVPPQHVLQRLEEERKRIDEVYEKLNKGDNIYDLIKRIKASDATRRPLTVLQSKMPPNNVGKS